jgi:hypothetical protein
VELAYYLSGPHSERTIFGLTTDQMTISQRRADYLMLDYVLARHQEIKRVVELGTFRGLTTLFLGVCMALRGGDVITVDLPRIGQINKKVKSVWPDNVTRVKLDALKQADQISPFFQPEMLLICDNGDKYTEAKLYAPLLPDNSLMMVHDRQTEFNEAQLVSELDLSCVYYDMVELLDSGYLVFSNKIEDVL